MIEFEQHPAENRNWRGKVTSANVVRMLGVVVYFSVTGVDGW
jgi:hypothetical protein